MQVVVAGLQHAGVSGDVDANLRTIEAAAVEARGRGARLLATPEMFLTGYNLPREHLERLAAEDLPDRVAAVARRTGVALAVGLPEPAGDSGLHDGGLHNSVLLVGADGQELTRYRKTHLFGDLDRALFVAGDDLGEPVEVEGLRVSLLVCYDVEFPEAVRHAAVRGADLVLVPTAQMEPFAHVAERLVRVRAWESQVHLAYVNRIGDEGDLHYVGRSSVVGPDGEVLDALPDDRTAGLVVATVDTDAAARSRTDNPYLDDRRPELY